MKRFVETVRDAYDFILIDTNPALGMLTINALTAAERVIIPVEAQYLPARGLEILLQTAFIGTAPTLTSLPRTYKPRRTTKADLRGKEIW